ncbi:hypothetical protein tb265_07720 [Gemmatimonadetes bacterium T265]|nr:hypothetical protein tb265_07720 [Gemmatimonadetes bacterium T265]
MARVAGAQPGTARTAGFGLRPSVGATAVVGPHTLGLLSAGLEGDAGLYARLGLVAGVGATTGSGGRAVGEVAGIGRFLLDPLRQAPRGIYATGGLAVRVERTARPRTFVLAGLGLEGRPLGRVVPAIEAGVGGGARLGVVLRPLRPGRR